jgi:hypothetical protein
MNWEMLTAIGQLATVCIGVPSIIYFAIELCSKQVNPSVGGESQNVKGVMT